MAVVYLAWRHLWHQRGASALLAGCLALVVLLPSGTRLLTHDFERDLLARARATPLVCGSAGSRADLVLAALWFRSTGIPPVKTGVLDELRQEPEDLLVPLNARFRARGRPVVATVPEYFEERGLEPATGELPLWLGECTLGYQVARDLGLGPGDELYTDALEQYDLAQAPPLAMRVVGTLRRTRGPDDQAVFATLETAWILEGLLHGHAQPSQLDPALLFGQSGDNTVVGPALIEHREVDPEHLADFHLHAEPDDLPLTAVLCFPASTKSRTMLRTRVNAEGALQVVEPVEVVNELLAQVLRVRSLLDLFALLLGTATVALGILVVLLSVKLRRGELATLSAIGAPRRALAVLVGGELALVAAAALATTAAGLLLVRWWVPDLMRLLS